MKTQNNRNQIIVEEKLKNSFNRMLKVFQSNKSDTEKMKIFHEETAKYTLTQCAKLMFVPDINGKDLTTYLAENVPTYRLWHEDFATAHYLEIMKKKSPMLQRCALEHCDGNGETLFAYICRINPGISGQFRAIANDSRILKNRFCEVPPKLRRFKEVDALYGNIDALCKTLFGKLKTNPEAVCFGLETLDKCEQWFNSQVPCPRAGSMNKASELINEAQLIMSRAVTSSNHLRVILERLSESIETMMTQY
ncbi:MAG: hypothetical protein LBF94_00745 [Puniceicoccales bacterium]|jgi:hypothetical protein|nr:hypothetical protein [Puniceicoccales bacterium]